MKTRGRFALVVFMGVTLVAGNMAVQQSPTTGADSPKPSCSSVTDGTNVLLRRSYATWLVEAGADPKAVQAQMRHSRSSTTMDIYAQFVPASQRRAVAQMMDMVTARLAKVAPASVSLN